MHSSGDMDGSSGPTITSLQDFATRMNQIPLAHQPSSKFEYSMAIELLGYIIEEVSEEKNLGEFLKVNVFEPLGMKDTSFDLLESSLDRFACCYVGTGENAFKFSPVVGSIDAETTPWLRGKPQLQSAGGGMLSTANDYMRFAEWLATGGTMEGVPPLVSPAMFKAMLSDQLRIVGAAAGKCFDAYQTHGLIGGVTCSPGLGGRYLPAGAASGLGAGGWGGVAGTSFASDPEHHLAIVIYSQELDYFLSSKDLRLDLTRQAYRVFPDLRAMLDAAQDKEPCKLMVST